MTDAGFSMPNVVGDSVVAVDMPCRKCQYNLRGLSSESRCPECGVPVGLSLRTDQLRYSDPDWIDTLRRGVNWILWAVVATILVFVLQASLGRRGPNPPVTVASFGAYALYVIGAWLLTTPDPGGLGEDRYGTSRKIIRITLLVGVVEHLNAFLQATLVVPPEILIAMQIIGTIAALVGLVGTFATLNYLGKLASRIPDDRLARRARTLMWGVGVPLGLLILVGIVGALSFRGVTRNAGVAPLLMFVGCAAAICGIALLVFGIMYLLFLEKLAKQFKLQAAAARQTWAAVPGPAV